MYTHTQISTTRRNDILLGFNETSTQLLPPLYTLISTEYGTLTQAKSTLSSMNAYLSSSNRTISQMTPEESLQYKQQLNIRDASGGIVADVLITLEKFCQSMPLDWMLKVDNGIDFVSALLFMLQEDTSKIQLLSVSCIQQLSMRKLDQNQWLRLVTSIPSALFEASNAAAKRAAEKGVAPNSIDMLVEQLDYHKSISKMCSTLISAHLAHITTDKEIGSGKGDKFDAVSTYL